MSAGPGPAVLVTGGLGFIGQYVVERLAESGRVVVSYNRDYAESDDPRVRMVQGELFDLPRLVRTIQDEGVDRIIHTAAMSHPTVSIDLPITTFAANVDGTLKVFEAARLAGVRRIVNFSSECAYGHCEGPVSEDAPRRPLTPYGVTKVTTELLADVYNVLYGMDIVSLRITEVWGPRNRMPGPVRDLLRAAIDGSAYELDHGADHCFNLVHARDVARAAVLAADADDPSQPVFNVAGGDYLSFEELSARVREIFPDARIALGPGPVPDRDRQGPYSIEAARRELGYEPEWTLERGLGEYADWLRSNPA